MNNELFERLLYEEESTTLDFKKEQYRFAKATDDEKSELLKESSVSPMLGAGRKPISSSASKTFGVGGAMSSASRQPIIWMTIRSSSS